MIKILNICYSDYANFMHDHSAALRSVGLDVTALKLKRHEFNYDNTAKVVTQLEMIKEISKADVIQIFHSCLISLKLVETHAHHDTKIICWHTGSPYRSEPEKMNERFNDICDIIFTDQCEFEFLGAKNLHYMATAVDTKRIAHERKGISVPYIFAHYPSNPDVKGTQDIRRMIQPLENAFRDRMKFSFDINKFEHKDQLKRMQLCDIYIELFKPTLLGKPYGCYGVTAFEASALGKIVVTNNIFPNVYFKAYEIYPPFVIANNEKEFRERMDELIHLLPSEVLDMQNKNREWIEQYHSYEASGNYWKKILSL